MIVNCIKLFYKYNFLWYALAAGLGISLIAGPIGSLMLWRRTTCLGDTLAHSTLLGMAIALALNVSPYVGIALMCFLMVIIFGCSVKKYLASEAMLTLLAQVLLAVGVILLTKLNSYRGDILNLFFGDILTISNIDLAWIYSVVVGCFFIIVWQWSNFVNISVAEELAIIDGLSIKALSWLFLIIIGIVFAVAAKTMGMLLVTALFIIPATTARILTHEPEHMAILSSILSGVAVVGGLLVSIVYNWPSGASIVFISGIMLAVIVVINAIFGIKYL